MGTLDELGRTWERRHVVNWMARPTISSGLGMLVFCWKCKDSAGKSILSAISPSARLWPAISVGTRGADVDFLDWQPPSGGNLDFSTHTQTPRRHQTLKGIPLRILNIHLSAWSIGYNGDGNPTRVFSLVFLIKSEADMGPWRSSLLKESTYTPDLHSKFLISTRDRALRPLQKYKKHTLPYRENVRASQTRPSFTSVGPCYG